MRVELREGGVQIGRARGVHQVLEHLRAPRERSRDMRPAMYAIVDQLREEERIRFETGGRGEWKRSDPDTVLRKARGKAKDPTRTLVDRGRLEKSLTAKRARYGIRRVGRDRLLFGTKYPVAHLQDRGSGGGHVPARPLFNLGVRFRLRAVRTLFRWVTRGRV